MTSDLAEAPRPHEARRRRRAGDPRRHHIDAARPRSAAVLHALSERGITRLLVEGGARVAASFVTAGLVDEFWLLRGPEAIGADGIAALDALPLSALTGRLPLRVVLARRSKG